MISTVSYKESHVSILGSNSDTMRMTTLEQIQ